MGIDLFDMLKRHDFSTDLKSLGDAILTGHTKTKVNNLRMLFIDQKGVDG